MNRQVEEIDSIFSTPTPVRAGAKHSGSPRIPTPAKIHPQDLPGIPTELKSLPTLEKNVFQISFDPNQLCLH